MSKHKNMTNWIRTPENETEWQKQKRNTTQNTQTQRIHKSKIHKQTEQQNGTVGGEPFDLYEHIVVFQDCDILKHVKCAK